MKKQVTMTDAHGCTCNDKKKATSESDIQVALHDSGLDKVARARASRMLRDQHDGNLKILDDGSAVHVNHAS